MSRRFGTLILALGLDLALGEPPASVHPVVWIGKAIDAFGTWVDTPWVRSAKGQCAFGVAQTLAIVGGAALLGRLAERQLQRLPESIGTIAAAGLLSSVISVRALVIAIHELEQALDARELVAAREAARALVSRPTDTLNAELLTSAGIESLAENAADSIVAPILYYVVGGLPGAIVYRAANTLDAMIGYHGRLEYLGKAAARLDDLLNLLPARITAGLLILGAPFVGGDAMGALRAVWRDAGATESPNAGWPMSAMAGALGIQLEKPGHYILGAPLPSPDTAALDHAVQIMLSAVVMVIPVAYVIIRLGERRARCVRDA